MDMYIDGPAQHSQYSISLWAGRAVDQILLEARFSAPIHTIHTSPGAHPPSYTMATGLFPGVKRPGHGVTHTPPSSAKVKERAEL
jgi:hypothetical protein